MSSSTATLCAKCKEAPGAYASRAGAQRQSSCLDCFSNYCTHNFRESALIACALPCGGEAPIAVAVSGGLHSLFALHQLGVLRKQSSLRRGTGLMRFVLLPFMVREDELVLPPPAHRQHQHLSPVDKLRSDVTAQFELLERQTREQMRRWSFAGEPLFSPGELRVFTYSQLLNTTTTPNNDLTSNNGNVNMINNTDEGGRASLAAVRSLVHHPRLSLSQREDVYSRVRCRCLAIAGARLADEWQQTYQQEQQQEQRQQEEVASLAADHNITTTTSHVTASAKSPTTTSTISGGDDGPHRCGGGDVEWLHLVTGESAERCAVAALSALVTARGGDAAAQASGWRGYGCHLRSGGNGLGVVTVRPVRCLLTREVALFSHAHGLHWGYSPSLATGTTLRSTGRVLESFVLSLAAGGYPAIVHNILNTAARLRVRPLSVAEVVRTDLLDARREREEQQQQQDQEHQQAADDGSANADQSNNNTSTSGKSKKRSTTGKRSVVLGRVSHDNRRRLSGLAPPLLSPLYTPPHRHLQPQQQLGHQKPTQLPSDMRDAVADRIEEGRPSADGNSTAITPVCVLCGVPGGRPCAAAPVGPSLFDKATTATATATATNSNGDTRPALYPLTIPPSSNAGGSGGGGGVCVYACHGCFLLIRDAFPQEDVAQLVRSATAAAPAPTPLTPATATATAEEGGAGGAGLTLLRLLASLSNESDQLMSRETRATTATAVVTGRKGEISAEDRTAFILDDEDE